MYLSNLLQSMIPKSDFLIKEKIVPLGIAYAKQHVSGKKTLNK